MIKLAVAGAAGRMGRTIIEASQLQPDMTLVKVIERGGSEMIGVDAGELAGIRRLEVPVSDGLEGAEFDVLVDFTNPGASLEHARYCAEHGRRLVIGTTGFTTDDKSQIRACAGNVAILMAPNMSVGVNVSLRLIEIAAQALGADTDIEIIEAHHRHKADAPSGTALRMGEVVARATGRSLETHAVYGRQGMTGERDQATIGFATVRGGDIVGEHTVMFAGAGERLEITHKASSRMNFASGALRAAAWVMQKQKGLFDMQDVLGLR